MGLGRFAQRFLDSAFLQFSRVVGSDDPKERGLVAGMILLSWLVMAGVNLYSVIDQWIFPINQIYLDIWKFRSDNVKSLTSIGAGLFLFLALVFLPLAISTAKRCASLIPKNRATLIGVIGFGAFFFAMIFTVFLNRTPEGALLLLALNALIVYVVSRLPLPK